MNALKLEGDCEKAIGLFLHALELDPHHADSLYYLANCLAETGNVDEAFQAAHLVVEETFDFARHTAVSLEPRGGSATGAPTGPILYVGKLTL